MITGESIPIDKKKGDKVIGSSINKNGYLQFKATSIGSNTVLASIIEMVKRAQMSKVPVQSIADRAYSILYQSYFLLQLLHLFTGFL